MYIYKITSKSKTVPFEISMQLKQLFYIFLIYSIYSILFTRRIRCPIDSAVTHRIFYIDINLKSIDSNIFSAKR